MQTQTSFSDLEYAAKKKQTRRDRFLGDIDAVTPWRDLVAVIEPFYRNVMALAGRTRELAAWSENVQWSWEQETEPPLTLGQIEGRES